jgi:archaetidylinositol phosphate synthase
VQSGLFCAPEAKAVNYLVGRIPARIGPDHLTFLAFAGAVLSGASLVGCQFSEWFLLPFGLGLAMNWFGDSLDGALARHRAIERERAGFLIDRGCDVLCFAVVILGLGQSQQALIGFGGVGATEGKLFVVFWVLAMSISHISFS